jgi:hypothetical protein
VAAVFLSVVRVCLTTGIHHEAMQLASRIPRLELKHPRHAALLVVLLMTLAHVVEILFWGIAFYLLGDHAGDGPSAGAPRQPVRECGKRSL